MTADLAVRYFTKEYVIQKWVRGDRKSLQNDAKTPCHVYKYSWVNESEIFDSCP